MVIEKILAPIIIAFVAVIIGISLFTPVADSVGSLTTTFTITNKSFTALNDTDVTFTGSGENDTAISAVRNNASLTLTDGANYTSNVTGGTGRINMNISYAAGHLVNNQTWFVDYTYQTNDYIEDGGSRAITNLIPIFFAIAIIAGAFLAIRFDMFSRFKRK